MNIEQNKSQEDLAPPGQPAAETNAANSSNNVPAVDSQLDSESADGNIVRTAIKQQAGKDTKEESAVKHLRYVTDNRLLKSVLNRYLQGGFESEPVMSALRLVLSDGDAEEVALRYLRKITASPTLKVFLTRYQNGDLNSERAQAALRLLTSDVDPEANAIANLRDTTESLFLKAFLNHYLAGELNDPAVQSELRSAFPKTRRDTESELLSTAGMATAVNASHPEAANSHIAERQFVAINSFPKSGNTWIRSFISHLCFDGSWANVPEKYHENILQAPVYCLPDGRRVRFYKSHDKKLVSAFRDRGLAHAAVIHIRRHPLDVFFSYLNFTHLAPAAAQTGRPVRDTLFLKQFSGVDEILESDMLDAFFGIFLLFGTLNPQFIEAGSWYDNMRYWTSQPDLECPVFHLRYEDLLANQAQELSAIGEFLGKDEGEVQRAFLAAQKATAKDGRFFWKQRSGIYKDALSLKQIDKYRSLFGEELDRYGYSL